MKRRTITRDLFDCWCEDDAATGTITFHFDDDKGRPVEVVLRNPQESDLEHLIDAAEMSLAGWREEVGRQEEEERRASRKRPMTRRVTGGGSSRPTGRCCGC